MAAQQQHTSSVQLGQPLGEGLILHSEGMQPQSAHLISMLNHNVSYRCYYRYSKKRKMKNQMYADLIYM